MIRTYKRKLDLTGLQYSRIDSWIGACRLVYNLGMEIKNKAYKDQKILVTKYDLMRQLPGLKEDFEWIKDVPSQSLQAALERLEISYLNFFRMYKKGGGYPKFSNKRKYRSILLKSIRVNGNYVVVPKIGRLKMVKDAPVLGIPNTATIIKENTGYFICIQCKDVPPKFISESQAIGLDMGISHFCIDSNGNFITNPKHFKKYERQLRIANRSLSRKVKMSNSWVKQSRKVSLIHQKIANARKDFLHKESTKIAQQNSVVYMEKLTIKKMVKTKRLSKHIIDAGWGMFKTMLSYKTKVVLVNPAYTSQKCASCFSVSIQNRSGQNSFLCISCGHSSNADINAAINIKREGISQERKRKAVA